MKSGRGSITDPKVCDDVQAGINNQAQDTAARNMSTVQNINTRRQQEVNRASCIWANKTGVVAPTKQTREKVVGDGDPTSPRTGRALILKTDNKNSGPRGH